MNMYDHSIIVYHEDGSIRSVCVAEYDGHRVLRSNTVTCTGVDGTPAYHDRFLAAIGGRKYRVIAGTDIYKSVLAGGFERIAAIRPPAS